MTVNNQAQYKNDMKGTLIKFFALPIVVLFALFSMTAMGMKGVSNADSMVSAKALDPNNCVSGTSISSLSHPGNSNYSYYDTVQAKWTFSIPTSEDIQAGDTLTHQFLRN